MSQIRDSDERDLPVLRIQNLPFKLVYLDILPRLGWESAFLEYFDLPIFFNVLIEVSCTSFLEQ